MAFGDCLADIFEERTAWVRIRIDKDQPVARGNARTPVARPANLIDRLENHSRAARAGNPRRRIRGIFIADDDFVFPLPGRNGMGRREDALERGGEQLLLVERGYDDRKLHAIVVRRSITREPLLSPV